MEGQLPQLLTVAILARELGLSHEAVVRELNRLGIKPGARAGVVRVYQPAVLEQLRQARERREAGTLKTEGGDRDLLNLDELSEILEVSVAELRMVVGAGRVSPAVVTGAGPLLRRDQLAAIRDALAGKKLTAEAPVLFPGPGLVRPKPAKD